MHYFIYSLSKYSSAQYDQPIFIVAPNRQIQNQVFALMELTMVEKKALNKFTDKYIITGLDNYCK